MVVPLVFSDKGLWLLDQRLLPASSHWQLCQTSSEVAHAIEQMVVRGAPAIGVSAAYGAVLAAWESSTSADFQQRLEVLRQARPTAVNLAWALEKMQACWQQQASAAAGQRYQALLAQAQQLEQADVAANRQLGRNGAQLLPQQGTVLTHCNAGALATAGYGTALGVIRAAVEAGKEIAVVADETRPYWQGSRLTCWELLQDGIDVTLICDNMAGYMLQQQQLDAVVVGADRIVANGDSANKIGTYAMAVLARYHQVPFYVAAPLSTVDLALTAGQQIPIEERTPREVTHCGDQQLAPEGVRVRNPAFDVTPAELITAIITEAGVAYPPYTQSLAALFEANDGA